MDNKVWTDARLRSEAIDRAALDNAILYNALKTARANGLSRSTGLECALLALCEENKRLFDHAVDAESRAVPRNRVVPY